MDSFFQDLRYGVRTLLKSPGFVVASVMTLALGMGSTTAIFSVVDAVLIKRLPYKDPDRIVAVWEKTPEGHRNSVSSAEFIDWRNQNRVFDALVAVDGAMFNLSDKNQPEQVLGILGSAGLFQVLGVNPFIGRGFMPEEENPGRDRVVVLGHGLWQRQFQSDRSVVGKSIRLNDENYFVIGVMPAKCRFLSARVDLWMPLALKRDQLNRELHNLNVYGRLKRSRSIEGAQADMNAITVSLEKQYPESHRKNWGTLVLPLRDQIVTPELRQSLLIFFAAVGAVLLIACVNVANLLLARGSVRSREVSIRAALGAGRFRLMRQFLTENVLLSVLGGVLGLAFSFGLVGLSRTLLPAETLPAEAEVTVNLRVLAFAGVVSLLTGLFFGLAPSWSSSKTQLTEILKAGARSASSRTQENRFRSILVISEVALEIMLLVGAGLLVRSWNLLQQVNPGFAPDNVLTLELTLPETKYFDAGRISNFYQGVLQRIKASPDIQQAAMVTEPPLAGSGFWMFFTIEGHPPLSVSERPSANSQIVSPGYFGALSIPILKGRDFTEDDKLGSPSVAIINETIARQFFPNEDPVGKRINIESRVPGQRMLAAATPREIVGVVGNVKIARLVDQPYHEVYVPHSQNPWTSMCLVVRTNNPFSTVSAVNQAVREIDKTQPVTNIRSMHQIVAESLSEPRFRTLILSAFSVVAFLLSALGIYGLMSYTVSQRTQEIGIRMALGANRREVLRLIVGQGMVLVLVGLIVGVLASLVVNRALSSFLFGVGTADTATFCEMSLLVLVVAFLACYLPARRAAMVDPIVALRCE